MDFQAKPRPNPNRAKRKKLVVGSGTYVSTVNEA
jgi:hypothetical protein